MIFELQPASPLAAAWAWWREEASAHGCHTPDAAFAFAVRAATLYRKRVARGRAGRPEDEGDRLDSPRAATLRLTPNQNETIERAVMKLRAQCDDPDIPTGRALELIAADYLA